MANLSNSTLEICRTVVLPYNQPPITDVKTDFWAHLRFIDPVGPLLSPLLIPLLVLGLWLDDTDSGQGGDPPPSETSQMCHKSLTSFLENPEQKCWLSRLYSWGIPIYRIYTAENDMSCVFPLSKWITLFVAGVKRLLRHEEGLTSPGQQDVFLLLQDSPQIYYARFQHEYTLFRR